MLPWLQGELVRWCAVLQFSLKQQVLGEPALDQAAVALLAADEAAALRSSPSPALLCMAQLRRVLIEVAAAGESAKPAVMDMIFTIDKAQTALEKCTLIAEQV